MMPANVGPPGPEDGSGPAPRGEPDHTVSAAAKQSNTTSVDSHDQTLTAFRRRRKASWRLIPLACGCRDPWPCRCARPALSEKFTDAGAQAAHHLLDRGCAPLIELDIVRALWRRSGDDRQLAEELHELTEGTSA